MGVNDQSPRQVSCRGGRGGVGEGFVDEVCVVCWVEPRVDFDRMGGTPAGGGLDHGVRFARCEERTSEAYAEGVEGPGFGLRFG